MLLKKEDGTLSNPAISSSKDSFKNHFHVFLEPDCRNINFITNAYSFTQYYISLTLYEVVIEAESDFDVIEHCPDWFLSAINHSSSDWDSW